MAIRCVAGLGNPGPRYEWTRHNAGFWVVDRLAREASLRWRRIGEASEAGGEIAGRSVVLLKPLRFMNASGFEVLACLERHQLTPAEMLVVVDDVALEAGRLRMRPGGGAGGHRGLASIEDALGVQEYPRLRVGVAGGRVEEDLADYVLRPLDEAEKEVFEPVIQRCAAAARDAVREGIETAMNRYNPAPPESSGPLAAPAGGPGPS